MANVGPGTDSRNLNIPFCLDVIIVIEVTLARLQSLSITLYIMFQEFCVTVIDFYTSKYHVHKNRRTQYYGRIAPRPNWELSK